MTAIAELLRVGDTGVRMMLNCLEDVTYFTGLLYFFDCINAEILLI